MKVMAGCTLICLMSCTNLVQSDSEIVLCPGDAIMATKNTSKLTVTAINDVTRRYKIDGFDETLNLRPRPMRWFGSLGIYSPSGINGVHMVLEEGQQFFSSEEDALHWISIMPGSRKNFNLVSSSNGVVVGWVKENDILLVQVWQVYIDGKIPVYFSGSNDAKITVDRTHHGDNTCPKKGTFIANKPRVIKVERLIFFSKKMCLLRI